MTTSGRSAGPRCLQSLRRVSFMKLFWTNAISEMKQQNGFNGAHTSDDHLQPTRYLEEARADQASTRDTTALIILNSPIANVRDLQILYNHAGFRICADGGANRLHDLVLSSLRELELSQTLLPDLIHGDLDSLRQDVREHYKQLGVEITFDSDQYSTDFGKAIKQISDRRSETRDILICGSLGGRVDQGIGLLHEIYREQKLRHPQFRFWLSSESSITTLLASGTTTISTPLSTNLITCNIGILPLYGPAHITTNGLEWDVQDWPTEMGGQVSTSNHIMADIITITTDREVLFTVERITEE